MTGASKSAFRGLNGPDRAALYLLATMTGLRANELATLQRSALNFASDPPKVKVDAANDKSGRGAELPLHGVVVNRLSAWMNARPRQPKPPEDKQVDEFLWPGT